MVLIFSLQPIWVFLWGLSVSPLASRRKWLKCLSHGGRFMLLVSSLAQILNYYLLLWAFCKELSGVLKKRIQYVRWEEVMSLDGGGKSWL